MRFLGLLVVPTLLMISGCSSIPAEKLVPEKIAVKQVDGVATVRVSGAREQIAKNQDIKAAVEIAILESGLFSGIGRELNVSLSILAVENPLFGMDMTSDIRIRWQVYDKAAGEEVFNSVISSTHTSTVGDQLVGVLRLKEANQNAIKKNISEAIARMSDGLAP